MADHDRSPVFVACGEGPNHRFTFANAAYKRLVGHEDLIGRTVAEVMPEICNQGFIELLDHVFATGEPYVGTDRPIVFAAENGVEALHYITFIYQPVRATDGKITGIFCEGFDVTMERLVTQRLTVLQTELAHLSRVNAMSVMATTIAHELNQPLAAIRNYAAGALRLLKASEAHTEILADALMSVDEAAERAGEIITNVRTLMKRGETSRKIFELRPAVAESMRLVLAGVASKVSMDNSVPTGTRVLGDRVQIQQVIINLLRNAMDAAAGELDNARIIVSAVQSAARVTISVSDNGPGVSVSANEQLFEWTPSLKDGGMGLGLSISRSIIEAHGGSFWLAGTSSLGSEFCFTLPAAVATEGGSGA